MTHASSEAFTDLFPLAEDATPYRKLSGDFVETADFAGEAMLRVDPAALTLLAEEAFRRGGRDRAVRAHRELPRTSARADARGPVGPRRPGGQRQ